MTPAQLQYGRDMLPIIEARRAYPLAMILAEAFNMMGGKRQRDDKGKGEPPLRPEERYTPEEFLPPFAWLVEPVVLGGNAVELISAAVAELPSWVIEGIKQQQLLR